MNKKAYIRPDVQLVDFSLTSSIAGTCTLKANTADANSCEYIDNGMTVFLEGPDCTFPIEDGGMFCYHVPTDDNRIFAS